jgi:RNA polymerase sigma-70 factor (ECF subfamily)
MIQQINLAKLGNQKAFTILYDFYWKRVYGFMLNRTKNETISRDITHETLVKAFIKINTYKCEYEFNTWLCAIAKNVQFNFMNKKALLYFEISESYCSIADSSPSPEDKLINKENKVRLKNSINQLNPNHREVFLLRDNGLSYDEIVDRTGDSLGNVKAKLSRARGVLACLVQK